MITVQIPATSANVGAGFDSLGLAVTMYNKLRMQEHDGLVIRSADGVDIPCDESNLVYQTVLQLYRECGKTLPGLYLEQTNNIPLARGLGSSSACIVGGLLGANHLLGSPLSQDELIDMAAVLEGHPDNSTPVFTGGLITSVLEDGRVYYVKQELPEELQFVAIIPDFELKTSLARSALPQTVSHADARFNLSRAALMALSLCTGKYENLRIAADDRLHQPHRLALIPHGGEVMELCQQHGAYASYISGAGSTLMAMVDGTQTGFAEKLRSELDAKGLHAWQLHVLSADNRGAVIREE